MATQLDLEEQEQLDQLKAFWKKYGNLITWGVIVVLAAFAGYNFWQNRQHEQAAKAGVLYDELDRAARANDAAKVAQVFGDLKQHFGSTGFAQQGALLAAKSQLDQGKPDDAIASLGWAIEHATETEYRTVARLRLAGVLLDQKKPDEALKQLDGADAPTFAGLVADRRGDILAAQGKTDEAKAAYQQAYKAMDDKLEYRRLVEAKLTALGASPETDVKAAS